MIDRYYIDAFEVLRNTETPDTGGAVVESEVVHSAGNKGCIEALTGNENIINDQKQLRATYRLYCSLETDLRITDKVRSSGVTYEIVFIQDHRFGINNHKEVYLGVPAQ